VPFRPFHQDHAIVEVVFHISLTGTITPEIVARIRDQTADLRSELPAVTV
jgi:hypothetical protein